VRPTQQRLTLPSATAWRQSARFSTPWPSSRATSSRARRAPPARSCHAKHAALREALPSLCASVDRLAFVAPQEAEASAACASAAALERELASATAEADRLTLCSRGGGALRVFFGAPWFVTRTFRRLADAPPTRRHAALLPLPAAPALALVAGAPAASADNDGSDEATNREEEEEEADEAAANAYSLSLSAFAWRRAGGLACVSARVDAAAAATLPPAGSTSDEATAGGVVLLAGGRVAGAGGAGAPPALLRCASDGALRWAPASEASVATSPGAPPCRLGAACAASPCGRYIHFFGGADATDGSLSADVATWDGHSRAWMPQPTRAGPARAASPRRSSMSGSLGGSAGGGLPAYNAPRPRRDAALAAAPDGRTLWVYGGAVAGGAGVADAFSYDISTGAWRARETAVFAGGAATSAAAAAAAAGPGPRRGAAATVQGRYLLLAGGIGESGPMRDAWALDTEAFVWECLLQADLDPNAGDAAAAPGAVALCAWRGATLCVLRGGLRGRFDLLESAHFMLPDDLDALCASRGARARARFSAGALRADGDEKGTDVPGDALRLWTLAARGSTWLDVAWRPPARRAERVTGYRLMLAPAGACGVRTSYAGPATHARVGGLRPATEYVCVVKAQYADGSHEWSDTEAFTTAPLAVPKRPLGGFSAHLRGSRKASPQMSAAAAAAVEAAEAAGGDDFPTHKPPPKPPREPHAPPPPLELPSEHDAAAMMDEGGPTPTPGSINAGTPYGSNAAMGGGITPPSTPPALAAAGGGITPRASPRLSAAAAKPGSAAAEAAAAWDAGEADASFAVVVAPEAAEEGSAAPDAAASSEEAPVAAVAE